MSSYRRTIRRSQIAVLTVALLSLGLLAGIFAAPAATQAGPAYQGQTPRTVSIAAGATLTMKVRGFCLDFGKPFPTGATTANGVGANNVRGALNYALGKGYTDSNAQQVQLAVWYLRDNTWHDESHTIAQEIVDNASASAPANGTGTSLAEAVTAGTLTASATFVPQTADAFYGDGNLEIKNTSSADVNIYLPIGTVFRAGTAGEFQDLLAYELTAAQPGATTTVSGTTTVTGTTTSVATTTVTGTSTVEATTTVTGTAVATGTVELTTTPLATTAVETATPAVAATTAVETTTPLATATTAAVPTAEPTATAIPGGGVLPQTGGPDALTIVLLLGALALAIAGFGLIVRFNPRT